jgi:hypothetical protein
MTSLPLSNHHQIERRGLIRAILMPFSRFQVGVEQEWP